MTMRKVVTVLARRPKTIRTQTRNSLSLTFVDIVKYELECGHRTIREVEKGTAPSARLKCRSCAEAVVGA